MSGYGMKEARIKDNREQVNLCGDCGVEIEATRLLCDECRVELREYWQGDVKITPQ